jgi:hypothetical protein
MDLSIRTENLGKRLAWLDEAVAFITSAKGVKRLPARPAKHRSK